MRVRSNSNLQEPDPQHDHKILTKAEHTLLNNKFKKNEQAHGRGISFYDMVNILAITGFNMTNDRKQKLNRDILARQIKILDLSSLYWAAASLKRQRQDSVNSNNPQSSQYLDAFIALGGNIDTSGFVNKQNLMKILQQQFGIDFQIQKLMQGLDFNITDKLDFGQFCELFEKNRAENPNNNVMDLLSARHHPQKEFVFTEKQFQSYENNFQHQN